MRGSSRTRGFSANLGSRTASSTTKISVPVMACPQKERSRELSPIGSPCFDLNHCLSPSTNEMPANGTAKTFCAIREILSKRSSGVASTAALSRNSTRRSASSCGMSGRMTSSVSDQSPRLLITDVMRARNLPASSG